MSTDEATDLVLRSHRSGIAAIRRITARFDAKDWTKESGCSGWTALDLAGHLVCVVNLWHELLDRAEAGDSSVVFPWDQFDDWNASALQALPAGTGPDRIEAFAVRASAFVDRLSRCDDLPFGAPSTTISVRPMTVRLFASFATAEWHLHARDFAIAVGDNYQPVHAAAALMMAGLRDWLGLPEQPGDPWSLVLALSGRSTSPAA